MPPYDKPFKSYPDLIQILIDKHGLIISDRSFAEHALKTFSYYDLINGYKDSMMDQNDIFKPGISIEYLYTFYLFDKKFQSVLFSRIMFIENFFKTTLAYCIARDFGVHQDDYLDKKNYNFASGNVNFNSLQFMLKRILNNPHPFQPTAYYLENHNHVPPWILFKNIKFSHAINLFRVLKSPQKNFVANELLPNRTIPQKEKIEFLISGLNLIRQCRNYIAHNLKFVTYQATKKDALKERAVLSLLPPTLISLSDTRKKTGTNDIYAVILFIYSILNSRYLKNEFFKDLKNAISLPDGEVPLFPAYATITKLPIDLEQRIKDTLKTM